MQQLPSLIRLSDALLDMKFMLAAFAIVWWPQISFADTAPPGLVSVSFSPTTINVSNSSATVTVTTRLTDDVSGVRYAIASFRSPSGTQNQGASITTRSSGTANDGIWTGTMTVPQNAETGTWQMWRILVEDNVGNVALYYASGSPAYPPGTNSSLVVQQVAVTPRIIAVNHSAAGAVITFSGTQQTTYRLERKIALTDLTWEAVPSVPDQTLTTPAPAQFTDGSAATLNRAFYRVRIVN